jgi:hypothetical protein
MRTVRTASSLNQQADLAAGQFATRPSTLTRLTLFTTLAWAVTSSWTAVRLPSGLILGDALLVASLLLVLACAILGHARIGSFNGVGAPLKLFSTFLTVWALTSAFPPDGRHIPHIDLGTVQPSAITLNLQGNTPTLARAALAILGVAVLSLASVEFWGRGSLLRLAKYWTLSAVVSSIAAILQSVGLMAWSGQYQLSDASRRAGLAFHPNAFGVGVLIALPIALELRRKSASRAGAVAWTICVTTMVGGIWFSQSRGALLVAGVVLVLEAVRALRRPSSGLLLATTLLVIPGACAAILYSPWQSSWNASRFSSQNTGAQMSSIGRSLERSAAAAAFRAEPIHGYGLQFIGAGSAAPYGLLASGGLTLFLGFYGIHSITACIRTQSMNDEELTLSRSLRISLLAFLLVGLTQNSLVERHLYIPIILLGLLGRASAARHLEPQVGSNSSTSRT